MPRVWPYYRPSKAGAASDKENNETQIQQKREISFGLGFILKFFLSLAAPSRGSEIWPDTQQARVNSEELFFFPVEIFFYLNKVSADFLDQ